MTFENSLNRLKIFQQNGFLNPPLRMDIEEEPLHRNLSYAYK